MTGVTHVARHDMCLSVLAAGASRSADERIPYIDLKNTLLSTFSQGVRGMPTIFYEARKYQWIVGSQR